MTFSPRIDARHENPPVFPRSIEDEAFILASWIVFTTQAWAENPDWQQFQMVKSAVQGRLYMGQNVDIIDGREAYQAGAIWKLHPEDEF